MQNEYATVETSARFVTALNVEAKKGVWTARGRYNDGFERAGGAGCIF